MSMFITHSDILVKLAWNGTVKTHQALHTQMKMPISPVDFALAVYLVE
jgi:hypothetical protein